MPGPSRPSAHNEASRLFDQVKAAFLRQILHRRATRTSYSLDVLPAGSIPLGHFPGRVDTHTLVPRRYVTATGVPVHLPADGTLPESGPERFEEVGSSTPPAVPPSPPPGEGKPSSTGPVASGSNPRPRKRARAQSTASLSSSVVANASREVSPQAEETKTAPERPDEVVDLETKPASSSQRKRARRESVPHNPPTRLSRTKDTPSRSVPKRLPTRSSPRIRKMSESNATPTSTQPKTERKTPTKRQHKR